MKKLGHQVGNPEKMQVKISGNNSWFQNHYSGAGNMSKKIFISLFSLICIFCVSNSSLRAGDLGYVNVKDCGATGNGTTDDSDAVQLAVNNAIALPTGGTVFFPAGKYRITKAILCNYIYPKGLKLSGAGMGQTVVTLYGNYTLFNVQAPDEGAPHSGFVDAFVLENMTLTSSDAIAKVDSIAVSTKKFESRWLISHCKFTGWGKWAVVVGESVMEGAIRDCSFLANNRGIVFDGYNDQVVVDCCSFWGQTNEHLRTNSSRVRISRTFFGKAATAIIFGKGGMQRAKRCSIEYCDFEGQQDMTSFISVGADEASDSLVYERISIQNCVFGVNPKSATEVHNVPYGIMLKNPVKELLIENCKFVNVVQAAVNADFNSANDVMCINNSYRNNNILNTKNANALHILNDRPIFSVNQNNSIERE